jgi:MoxR-like ATPase
MSEQTKSGAERFAEQYERIRAEIAKEMIGQQEVVEHLLMAVIAGGNVLLEGVPGLGKTHLVRVLGKVLDK